MPGRPGPPGAAVRRPGPGHGGRGGRPRPPAGAGADRRQLPPGARPARPHLLGGGAVPVADLHGGDAGELGHRQHLPPGGPVPLPLLPPGPGRGAAGRPAGLRAVRQPAGQLQLRLRGVQRPAGPRLRRQQLRVQRHPGGRDSGGSLCRQRAVLSLPGRGGDGVHGLGRSGHPHRRQHSR